MRDNQVIDSELRLLAAVRRTIHDAGGDADKPMDELLDDDLTLSAMFARESGAFMLVSGLSSRPPTITRPGGALT
ncbi:MAG: hypothetical protein JOZ23_06005 [Mycobacterium sp.]|nr:hypothetical protein [Mycobacterium sp.]